MAGRNLNMAALNAEILGRKRNISGIKKEADDPTQPKITKISKLHLKTDRKSSKNSTNDVTPHMERQDDDTNPVLDEKSGKTYADVHEQLKRKEDIYNQLKENPNVNISERLRKNITLDPVKNTYMVKDKFGRSKEIPVSQLPPEFFKNLGSSDEEDDEHEPQRRRHESDNSQRPYDYSETESESQGPFRPPPNSGLTNFMDNFETDSNLESELTGNVSGQTAQSANRMWRKDPVVVYDGYGGKKIKTFPIDAPLDLETRHANFMTEDRRDYGALYYNLGVGSERQKKMEGLEFLRQQTQAFREANNADGSKNPLDKFTPFYAHSYLTNLAYKNGVALKDVKEKLYTHYLDPLTVYERKAKK